MTNYAAQGRGWQGHISVKKVSLAKDTTLMGVLWLWVSACKGIEVNERLRVSKRLSV